MWFWYVVVAKTLHKAGERRGLEDDGHENTINPLHRKSASIESSEYLLRLEQTVEIDGSRPSSSTLET
jgi:hypothetical protein